MFIAKIKQKTIANHLYTSSIYCAISCCFFIPFSASLMGATAVLALLLWICSGRIFNLSEVLPTSLPSLFALSLFLLLTLGVFYSSVSFGDAASVLKKYRELVFFVMAYSLFYKQRKKAEIAEMAFIAGCVVLLTLSYAMYFSLIPTEKFGYSTVYHITHSFFMAVLAFWCLQRGLTARTNRYAWFIVALLASINLFYIAPGRTGMLVFVTLVLVTFIQRLSVKNSILAITAVCLFLTGSFFTSDNFASRIKLAIHEIEIYQPDAKRSRSSLGMRFDWWENSVELIKEKPLLGHGTGSFKSNQARLIKGTLIKPTDNPHNEYLFLAVQTGVVGTFLFLGLLASLLLVSMKIETSKKYLLQGVVIAMATGCLMNSFLFDSHQGHFFAIISALLSTGGSENNGA